MAQVRVSVVVGGSRRHWGGGLLHHQRRSRPWRGGPEFRILGALVLGVLARLTPHTTHIAWRMPTLLPFSTRFVLIPQPTPPHSRRRPDPPTVTHHRQDLNLASSFLPPQRSQPPRRSQLPSHALQKDHPRVSPPPPPGRGLCRRGHPGLHSPRHHLCPTKGPGPVAACGLVAHPQQHGLANEPGGPLLPRRQGQHQQRPAKLGTCMNLFPSFPQSMFSLTHPPTYNRRTPRRFWSKPWKTCKRT